MTNHNMKQIHISKYWVCIGLMLTFAGCIQLTYSGGEELKNEIIEVSMNLHNLR